MIECLGFVVVTGGAFRNNSALVAGTGLAGGGCIAANLAVQAYNALFESNSAFVSNEAESGTLLGACHSSLLLY